MLCCLLFTVALGGMVTCAYFGIKHGKPRDLIAPIDGDGKICGVTPGYEDYRYLFIGDITKGGKDLDEIFDYGICVQECPATAAAAKELKCKPTSKVPSGNMSQENSYAATNVASYCVPDYDTLDPSIKEEWESMKAKFK